MPTSNAVVKDAGLVASGMLIGYARVSTADQNLDLQRDALQRAGCAEIYEEKKSGRAKSGRPELANAMRALRPGDTLVVWRLDRLGRSLVDLVTIVNDLTKRQVDFMSLTEQINTGTAQGRMFLGVVASLAQYVREQILENTKEGLKAARARGRVGGRPVALDEQALIEIRALLADPAITVAKVAARYKVSRTTIYSSLARLEKAETLDSRPAAALAAASAVIVEQEPNQ